jgi:hypothetical protein
VWLAQHPTEALLREAEEIAALLGLPLTVLSTGDDGIERELERLLDRVARPAP